MDSTQKLGTRIQMTAWVTPREGVTLGQAIRLWLDAHPAHRILEINRDTNSFLVADVTEDVDG